LKCLRDLQAWTLLRALRLASQEEGAMSEQLELVQGSGDKIRQLADRAETALGSLADSSWQQFKNAVEAHAPNLRLSDLVPFSIDFGSEKVAGRAEQRRLDEAEKAAKVKEATQRLYGEFKDPLAAIKSDACIQPKGVGNCYFVAALASLAKVNPEAIKDMISVNDDGKYTVKFPGATSAITVDPPTSDDLKRVGGATKYGEWSLILQKAYGKYCGGGKTDLDGADGGSVLSAGLRVLCKNGVNNEGLGQMLPLMSWNSMDGALRNAVSPANPKDALPVTVSTLKSPFSDKTKDGFVRAHVYSVLDYKPDAQNLQQGKVTVRNPWGGADAVREITLQEFSDNFMQLSIPLRK
jgi:hypothetical protein